MGVREDWGSELTDRRLLKAQPLQAPPLCVYSDSALALTLSLGSTRAALEALIISSEAQCLRFWLINDGA